MHAELAKLDRQLQQKGEDVVLKRRVGRTDVYASLTCRAFVRGNKAKPIVGPHTQQTYDVVMSPSAIANANSSVWPGDAGGDTWPWSTDELVVKGKSFQVQSVGQIAIGDEMVRLELTVTG